MIPFLLAVPQSNPVHFLIGLTAKGKPQLGGWPALLHRESVDPGRKSRLRKGIESIKV